MTGLPTVGDAAPRTSCNTNLNARSQARGRADDHSHGRIGLDSSLVAGADRGDFTSPHVSYGSMTDDVLADLITAIVAARADGDGGAHDRSRPS